MSTSDAEVATDRDFLITMVTAVVLLAIGSLFGLFRLRDEHARLTALRDEVGQESVTTQQPARDHDADSAARGERPPISCHYQAS